MKTNISRRKFLFAGFGLSTLSLISGWWFLKVRKNDISPIINAIIKQELSYLKISPQLLAQFNSDLAAFLDEPNLKLISWIGMFTPLYTHTPLLDLNDRSRQTKQLVAEQVCTWFLLSTDFFQNNSDTSVPLRYLRFYNPNRHTCNSLAEF